MLRILWLALTIFSASLVAADRACASGSRLLGTGGVTQIEGAAGGGLVPWAVIAGLGSTDEIGGAGSYTHIEMDDARLSSLGVSLGLFNRVELSLTRQRIRLDGISAAIAMDTLGAKVRLAGDAIFDERPWMPQLSIGAQLKRNRDFAIPATLGARDDTGVDVYLAATKIFLAGLAGRTTLINATVRITKANQLGLLGFDRDSSLQPELSAAIFLTDHLMLGGEYRFKPPGLATAREDDATDVFLLWFPHKYVALATAYVDLGGIAGTDRQRGLYTAAQISF